MFFFKTKALHLLVVLVFLASSLSFTEAYAEPPYSGTVFVFPDTITADSASRLSDVRYSGQGTRQMFDRRKNSFDSYFAYLFTATCSDGLSVEFQINPEFGSGESAQQVAEFYALEIGRLPRSLRVDVRISWIHGGSHAWGGGCRTEARSWRFRPRPR